MPRMRNTKWIKSLFLILSILFFLMALALYLFSKPNHVAINILPHLRN